MVFGSCSKCGKNGILATKYVPVCRLCYGREWEAKNRRTVKKLVPCLECKSTQFFARINLSHLKYHGMTTEQYRQKYPSAKTTLVKIGTANWTDEEFIERNSSESKKAFLRRPENIKRLRSGLPEYYDNKEKVRTAMLKRNRNPSWIKARSNFAKNRTDKADHLKLMTKNSLKFREKNWEKWSEICRNRYVKYPHLILISSQTAKRTHKKHPELAAMSARKSLETQRNRIWKGAHFNSREEIEVAKLLCPNPKDGVNVQVPNGSFTADFFPEKKVFIEYHPNLWNPTKKRDETPEEYMAPRIKEARKKGFRIEFIFDRIKHALDRKSYNPKALEKIKKIKERYNLH